MLSIFHESESLYLYLYHLQQSSLVESGSRSKDRGRYKQTIGTRLDSGLECGNALVNKALTIAENLILIGGHDHRNLVFTLPTLYLSPLHHSWLFIIITRESQKTASGKIFGPPIPN